MPDIYNTIVLRENNTCFNRKLALIMW